ncbi:uncharacterized protein PGTG_09792 [Puccinia graminis f. sp. tritici CRL 75-36-700-3]|uniref:SUN domain-containing protein n=1 Tax=Puccinia graminis f. sp. tritici (strain CRL 75-36-700-3 / race SCCL) TaxID=418459 RepID=E3KEU9_PUCGT|nr:uncharacterized protein PGTG_09792 [Puccinia graminis f. sp. tritici CRL 75-36-700-3]EFP82824.2 hypothetical protein PGTG_09792 [Puccinia graminis f. sp. tritici CRL 75-36-700-3]
MGLTFFSADKTGLLGEQRSPIVAPLFKTCNESHLSWLLLNQKIEDVSSRIEALESSFQRFQETNWVEIKKIKRSKFVQSEGVKEVAHAVVKDALRQYSREQIGQQDFALYSGGARIIPSLTSKTYQVEMKGMKAIFISFWTGAPRIISGRGPIAALSPEIEAGMCWSISGSTGQLGVSLARRILVTSVSVEHISTLSAYEIDSSPKEMEVCPEIPELYSTQSSLKSTTITHKSNRQRFSVFSPNLTAKVTVRDQVQLWKSLLYLYLSIQSAWIDGE